MSFKVDTITAGTVQEFNETLEDIEILKKHIWFLNYGVSNQVLCSVKKVGKHSYDITILGHISETLAVYISSLPNGCENPTVPAKFVVNFQKDAIYFYINDKSFLLNLKKQDKGKS
jgi:hypothetical protein